MYMKALLFRATCSESCSLPWQVFMIWGSERTSKSPFLQNDRVHYNEEQSEDDQHFSGDDFTKSNSIAGKLEDTPAPYEKELAKFAT